MLPRIVFSLLTLAWLPDLTCATPESQQALVYYNGNLSRNFKINTDSRPFTKTNIQSFPCGLVTISLWDWNTLFKADKVTISNNIHTDADELNTSNSDSTFKSTKSTSQAISATEGWAITLSGSSTVGSKGLPSFTIGGSATYSDSSTRVITDTTTVEYATTCKAGYHCLVQTVTFTAEIEGTCWNESRSATGNDQVGQLFCKRYDGHSGCDELDSNYRQSCTSSASQRQPEIPCRVRAPIFQDDGTLLRMIILTSEKI